MHEEHPGGARPTEEDIVINERAPFTRRAFLATAGAAVAVAALPGRARASGGSGHFRIHPAIGFGRVGNAHPNTYFVGPEAPGFGPLGEVGSAVPTYKVGGLIKPQAARFRIFEYLDDGQGGFVPGAELTIGSAFAGSTVAAIEWTVHLANKKASFFGFEGGQGENREAAPLRNAGVANRASLEIDFGPRTIAGASQAPVLIDVSGPGVVSVPLNHLGQPVIDYLGQLRTDAAGRLIVIPGKGKAAYNTAAQPPMPHWANNDGWFDDASDGPVTARVHLANGSTVEMDPVGGAWILNGPPDFAPGIPGSVTGYDLLVDMAVRRMGPLPNSGPFADGEPLAWIRALNQDYTPGAEFEFPTFVPNFPEHIEPILVAAYNLWWVNALVNAKHNSLLDPKLGDPNPRNARARQRVLAYMRPPEGVQGVSGPGTMPKLMGDDPYIGGLPDAVRNLALTPTQYGLLRRWAAGAFTNNPVAPAAPTITAHGLDQAALENTVGGAFFPGIEFGWQFRNPALYAEPFRLDHGAFSTYLGEDDVPMTAGHFSRQMAVPWQADFNDCRNEGNYGWWPAQRPTHALPSAAATKREDWARPNRRYEGGNAESTHEDMVNHWFKYGFVVEDGNQFIEKERAASIP